MRTLAKQTSEPNLYGAKGNKPFAPVKRNSMTRPSDSYKLSSKVKNLLSNDLKTPSYGGCGDDSSIQSTNTRRRFQRRGSKSASMFKAFSAEHFDIPESLFDNVSEKPSNTRMNNTFLESVVEIQKHSERSCISRLGESSTTLDLDSSEEFACSSFDR